jgi:hypothetical protein
MVQAGRPSAGLEPKVLWLKTGLALAGHRRFRAQNSSQLAIVRLAVFEVTRRGKHL